MDKGKIIVIEGTDCSGKETQSKLLIEKLNKEGLETTYMSFPNYSSPSGKIVGLPYLGKEYLARELILSNYTKILKELRKQNRDIDAKTVRATLEVLSETLAHGWFPEGAPHVDAKVSSLYYVADRAYNVDKIYNEIENGRNVILDRYVYSNMAHQGGKISDELERLAMYEWLYQLEFKMMELPESDVKLFLHMPTNYTALLKKGRTESLDENEKDTKHLTDAERAYLEVANLYGFETIECIRDINAEISMENVKKPEEINSEVYSTVKKELIRH